MSEHETHPGQPASHQPQPAPEPTEHDQLLSPPRYQRSIESQQLQQHNGSNPLLVKLYRYFIVFLLSVALIWALALAVDAFSWLGLSAPQGSGLETLCILVISIASLVVTLMFYNIPSHFDKVMGYLTSIVVLVDIVMLLSVPDLRHRTGIVQGVTVYGFALFVFAAGALANAVVLSAQPVNDDRKTLFEWFEVFVFNAARLLLFSAVFILSANLAIDAADSNIAPLGRIVPIEYMDATLDIHVACTPAGKGPLVLLEAGHSSSEESARWVIGSDNLGAVCYWDRPGRGFSDNAPSSQSVGSTVDILMKALDEVRPGYTNESVVLVSHGVGSLYSRVLAARLGKSVKGMMLIDATHEELFYDTWGFAKSFWHFLQGSISPIRVGKIGSLLQSYGAEDRVYGRLEQLSCRYQKNLLQELASASRQSRRDIGDATLGLAPHIPLLVVSSSERCKDQQWSTYQRLLLKLSDNVIAWKIIEGPHELWKNSKSSKELSTLLESLAKYVQ